MFLGSAPFKTVEFQEWLMMKKKKKMMMMMMKKKKLVMKRIKLKMVVMMMAARNIQCERQGDPAVGGSQSESTSRV